MTDIITVLILIVIGYVIWLFKGQSVATKKGREGEQAVRLALKSLNSRNNKVLNDVIFKTPKGYTQIDHIVVSTRGVFIIETKNYSGKVYGKEDDKTWTQWLGGKTYKFYNPLKQNASHEKQVRRILGLHIKTIPLVCFSDATNCKSLKGMSNVTSVSDLVKTIKSFKNHALTSEQVDDVYYLLKSKRVRGIRVKLKHRIYVKSVQANS